MIANKQDPGKNSWDDEEVLESHQLTFMRWYNDEDGGKIASADVGPYEAIPYGTARYGEKHAFDKPPHSVYGCFQWGISCSRTALTIVIDVDDFDAYEESRTWVHLAPEDATSFRITPEGKKKLHFVVIVPEQLVKYWPVQGPTAWGDIKSNGFSYITGLHASGTLYEATGEPFHVADELLMRALQNEPRKQNGSLLRAGHAVESRAGAWTDDNYEILSDDQAAVDIFDMCWSLDDSEIEERLDVILPSRDSWNNRSKWIASKIKSSRKKQEKFHAEQEAEWQHQKSFFAGMALAAGLDYESWAADFAAKSQYDYEANRAVTYANWRVL